MAYGKAGEETWPMKKREMRLGYGKERDETWPLIKREMRLGLW